MKIGCRNADNVTERKICPTLWIRPASIEVETADPARLTTAIPVIKIVGAILDQPEI